MENKLVSFLFFFFYRTIFKRKSGKKCKNKNIQDLYFSNVLSLISLMINIIKKQSRAAPFFQSCHFTYAGKGHVTNGTHSSTIKHDPLQTRTEKYVHNERCHMTSQTHTKNKKSTQGRRITATPNALFTFGRHRRRPHPLETARSWIASRGRVQTRSAPSGSP